VASDEAAIAVNREAFAVARALAPRLQDGRGLFVTVQDTGGAFGLGPMDGRRAWLSGMPAFVKTASQEWPLASLKSIDLERGGRSAHEIARVLADELLGGGGEIEVALPAAGGRFTLRSVAEPVAAGQPVIGPGDVVVVSGGARGVTAACLKTWAAECRARFVLLGRTALAEPDLDRLFDRTLREVVGTLDPLVLPLDLTDAEIDDLVAFLETLTGTLDPALSEPPAIPPPSPF